MALTRTRGRGVRGISGYGQDAQFRIQHRPPAEASRPAPGPDAMNATASGLPTPEGLYPHLRLAPLDTRFRQFVLERDDDFCARL